MSIGISLPFALLAGAVVWASLGRHDRVVPQAVPAAIETSSQEQSSPSPATAVSLPAQAAERVTKKPFGIHIDPKASPVQPERFSGYHTGTDFEAFPSEADTDVSVHAICTGPLVAKRIASGYGGVAVQSCTLDGGPVTVVYGHLRLSSIAAAAGDTLTADQDFALLGMGYSAETDGEREHLHLGIHRGAAVSLLGYVPMKEQLNQWIDPCRFVCGTGKP